MIVTITCETEEITDYVYNLLTDPLSGYDVLAGAKTCIDYHEMVPDILEFDLTQEEIEKVRNIKGVKYVMKDCKIGNFHYDKTQQTNLFYPFITAKTKTNKAYDLPDGTTNVDIAPNSLSCHQNYKAEVIQNTLLRKTLSSIDCSNVDIIIADTGIMYPHYEFFDEQGNPNIVQFDWSQLREGDPVTGPKIITSLPPLYYSNPSSGFTGFGHVGGDEFFGHGTACASLAAGRTCGFAKNAKLYSLRLEDSTILDFMDGIKLALAFQKAKNLNLYGLDSTRPTIINMSFGYEQQLIINGKYQFIKIAKNIDIVDQNNINFNSCFDWGSKSQVFSKLPGVASAIDGYIRELLNSGMHVVRAAGNANTYLTNNPASSTFFHIFSSSFNDTYVGLIANLDNWNYFNPDTIYNDVDYNIKYKWLYKTDEPLYFNYNSPDIGVNFNSNLYPLITVGDISQVGDVPNNNYFAPYWSGCQIPNAYNVLSALDPAETRIDTTKRYNFNTGPYYVKTGYSNFGPTVDIYSAGNATAAAAAISDTASHSVPPYIAKSQPFVDKSQGINLPANNSYLTNFYQFFNGTSAACPIVVGILATYLSQNPSATPKEAKQWLLSNAVSGNIMETTFNTLPVSTYDGTNEISFDLPFASSDINNLTLNGFSELNRSMLNSFIPVNINIDDILFHCRFFNSNNLVAQAYPLRKAVEYTNKASINIAGTTLTRGNATAENITHTNFI